MKIDFYYWNFQCPYNYIIKELLSKYENVFDVQYHDISNKPQITKKIQMYSPTLIIFNNDIRWNGPITSEVIESIANGNIPSRKPYMVESPKQLFNGEVRPLTEETVLSTCRLCASRLETPCQHKAVWIENIRKANNLPHLGYLHFNNNQCVGGVEFTPSLAVPYPIPRSKNTAFLTCLYLSNKDFDYKTVPLKKLEIELPTLGFDNLIAIVSEDVVFPNGTLQWFLERGYQDICLIHHEEREFARMHLVKKTLV